MIRVNPIVVASIVKRPVLGHPDFVATAFVATILVVPFLITPQCTGQEGFVQPQTRLEQLDPSRPSEYRDLAEELSEVAGSRAAKDLTIRLYLITAAHSNGKLRRSALRGMLEAARTKEEWQKFKVLAYMIDDQFSDLLYRAETGADSADQGKDKTDATTRDKLTDAFRSLRQGKTRRAKKIMEDQTIQAAFSKIQTEIPLSDFLKACESGDLSNDMLLRLLEFESRLRMSSLPPKRNSSDKSIEAWRKLFKGRLPSRVSEINLKSITEFDPEKSVYRNGGWRKPAK